MGVNDCLSKQQRQPWNMQECFTSRSYEDGLDAANALSNVRRAVSSELRVIGRVKELEREVKMLRQDNLDLRRSLNAVMALCLENNAALYGMGAKVQPTPRLPTL